MFLTAWSSSNRKCPFMNDEFDYLLFLWVRYKQKKNLNILNKSKMSANCFSLHCSGLSVNENELIKIKCTIEWTKVSGSMKIPRINWHNLWASIELSTCITNRLHAVEMLEPKKETRSPRLLPCPPWAVHVHTLPTTKKNHNNVEISYHPINIYL